VANTQDGAYWKVHDLHAPLLEATRRLSDCQQVQFYAGWIPERFPDVMFERFALVHIDVDLYQPTLDSLQFFYPRLNTGGVLICDDYGSLRCPGATQACEEFLVGKPEQMIMLPAGGGFILKESGL
jgi:O-methyltransferase